METRQKTAEYHCQKCGMGVKNLTCTKCESSLENSTIRHEGKNINVAKCPNGCGMIKSPTCCQQDMDVS